MLRLSLSEQILAQLERGNTSTSNLMQATAVSQSTISRALRRLTNQNQVLMLGSRRGTRYALRRNIDRIGSRWPLRRVDWTGEVHEIGWFYPLAGNQYYLEVDPAVQAAGFAYGGLSVGLPHWLQDQRPRGCLGRAVPGRYPALGLPDRVRNWTDDHYLRYLTQRGHDSVSDLLLGDDALDHHLAAVRSHPIVLPQERAARYTALAAEVMAGRLPGAAVHGEAPKFVTHISTPSGPQPALIKFSPPLGSAPSQRWSDLLVAEHVAHEVLRAAGLPACDSSLFQFADRTYLEVLRFDRHGDQGRVGVASLLAIDTAYYGQIDNWIAAATRLHQDQHIDAPTLEQIRLLDTFGALIANSDRHLGNLAFYENYTGHFQLAPVYDMLPMLFAPANDQLIARVFNPPHPVAGTLRIWQSARELAELYWRDLAGHSQVSEDFRDLSNTCLEALAALPRVGAYA